MVIIMKIRNIIILLITMSLLTGLTACRIAPTPIPDPKPDPHEDILPAPSGSPLRVVFGYSMGGADCFDDINEILDEMNLNLVFEPFIRPASSNNPRDSFAKYIRENLSEDAVFITVPGWNIENGLKDENILGDFYELCDRYAPRYMEHATEYWLNEPGTISFLPTDFRRLPFPVPAVLVREDIAVEYGRDIRTASDYVDLLNWLKQRDPDSIPGIVSVDLNSNMLYMPLDFFLPEMGYGNMGAIQVYAIGLNTKQVSPTYLLPESRAALEEFARLRRDGLLYMINENHKERGAFNEYSTALVYSFDFTFAGGLFSSGAYDFDAGGYRMYTLYNRQLPRFIYNEYSQQFVAMAGPNTDISEFLWFLELLENREDYRRLFYGIEDIDFEWVGSRMRYLENDTDWASIRANLLCFARSDYQEIPLAVPNNFESEMDTFDPAYTVMYTQEMQGKMMQWWNKLDEADAGFANQIDGDARQMNRDLFWSVFPADEQRADRIIDDFIKKINAREQLLYDYTQMFEGVISNAGGG